MAQRELIVAVASPPGRGLRGLVRISGAGAREVAASMTGTPPGGRRVGPARVSLADGGSCPVIAMWMESGASFTGEDSLEFSCVGNPALLERLAAEAVRAAHDAGYPARFARAGEFAFRAHLAGRLSVRDAEAIAARIAATNDAELSAAAELASGRMLDDVGTQLAAVAELLALVEAGIDFTDQEDVVAIAPDALAARARVARTRCESLRGAGASGRTHALPTVVLAGPPNAGKSTLFNALVGSERTVASDIAGTTRDAIGERLALGLGIEVELVDLAGLDGGDPPASQSGVPAAMQRQALRTLAVADIVVRCTPVGAEPVELPSEGPSPACIDVCTKADLCGERAPGAFAVCAPTGEGLPELRNAIGAVVRADRALRRARLASILPRYDASLDAACSALREVELRAEACSGSGRLADVEVVASLLRAALDSLGEIAGPVHPDDVLGLVFSRFCVGK